VSGSVAKKIRRLIGYDKKNANPIQKNLYKRLKSQYNALGPEVFWKKMEGRFDNQD
tara:strand:- start:1402 stop:1569 length:168 start_codon:yes stop_codon:yes gene_type:complete